MTWLVWRLHRVHLVTGAVVLGVLVTVLVITGAVMHHDYQQALSTCQSTNNCSELQSSLFRGDGMIIDTVAATMAAPLLLGMFWGAPLVASEYEAGTADLAWTQGTTRRRWMSANLLQSLLVAAAWGAAISAIVGWWRGPLNAMSGALSPGAFEVQGVVPIAYAVFAMALGIAAGVTCRRTLGAIGATLVGFVGVRVLVIQFARPHYFAPVVQRAAVAGRQLPISDRAWLISKRLVKGEDGYHWILRFQPPGRFWAIQGVESAIFLVLAAGLCALATFQLLRRDA